MISLQGRGEYVLMKSTSSAFEVQGRFIPGYHYKDDASTTDVNEWGTEKLDRRGKGVSVAQAVTIDTGIIGAPQFDAVATNPESGKCGVNYYVGVDDGPMEPMLPAAFGDDGRDVPGIEFFHQVKVGKDHVDYVFFPESGIMMTVFVRQGTYGCVLAAKICLPPSMLAEEDIVGLMGTPNGDKTDEWMDSDGNTLNPRTRLWRNAYNYCTQNWCVRSSEESIFGYLPTESWATHAQGGCADTTVEYDPETEEAVSNPSPECAECCADSHEGIDMIQCLTECVEAGDATDGVAQCHIELETEATLSDVEKKCPDPVVVPKTTTEPPPGTKGDPHFRTHGGEMYDVSNIIGNS